MLIHKPEKTLSSEKPHQDCGVFAKGKMYSSLHYNMNILPDKEKSTLKVDLSPYSWMDFLEEAGVKASLMVDFYFEGKQFSDIKCNMVEFRN